MNVTQRTLRYLYEINLPVKKERIANEVIASKNSVANTLADLTRGYYVKQGKGLYVITPRGRIAVEEDPNLTDFEIKRTPRKFVQIAIPTQAIETSEVCHVVIAMLDNILQWPEDDEYLPFVLIWMAKNGYSLPDFKFKNTTPNKKLTEAMNKFWETLRSFDGES